MRWAIQIKATYFVNAKDKENVLNELANKLAIENKTEHNEFYENAEILGQVCTKCGTVLGLDEEKEDRR